MKVYILTKFYDIAGHGTNSNIVFATADKSLAEQAFKNVCEKALTAADINTDDEEEIDDCVSTYDDSHTNEDGITEIEKSYSICYDNYYVQVKLVEKELSNEVIL